MILGSRATRGSAAALKGRNKAHFWPPVAAEARLYPTCFPRNALIPNASHKIYPTPPNLPHNACIAPLEGSWPMFEPMRRAM
jgi:hypothetical protein